MRASEEGATQGWGIAEDRGCLMMGGCLRMGGI